MPFVKVPDFNEVAAVANLHELMIKGLHRANADSRAIYD